MGSALSTCVPVRSVELFQAARRGDVQTVTALLRLDPGLLCHQSVINRNTVWHVAGGAGALEVLAALLRAGRDRLTAQELKKALDARNDRGQTPLMQAAIHGRTEAVRWLLSHGVDPWVTETNCHRTALHYAALRGHSGCVEALLERFGTAELCRYLDARTCSGMTALHYACVGNQAEAARQLLQRGADMLATTTLGDAYDLVAAPCASSPLHVAATINAAEAATELLRHYHTQLASPFYPDPRRRLDAESHAPYQVAAVRRYTVLAEALHPASDLSAMFEGAAAAAAAPAAVTGAGGGGGGCERVQRLSHLAGDVVRRQLLTDIEAAEKMVLAFRSRDPARFAPAAMAATQTPWTPFDRRSHALAHTHNDADADADCCALRYPPRAAACCPPPAPSAGAAAGASATPAAAAGVSPFLRHSMGSVADSAFARAPWLPVTQCAVCLEDDYCLLLEPCHHRLCGACARHVASRAAMPMPCPVCRVAVLQLTSPVC